MCPEAANSSYRTEPHAQILMANVDSPPELREEHLSPIYYPAERDKDNSPPEWHSPFYCPKGPGNIPIEVSTDMGRRLHNLIVAIYEWTNAIESTASAPKRNSLQKTILESPPIKHVDSMRLHELDYKYECCRLTATLLVQAYILGCTLSQANAHSHLADTIVYNLRKTDYHNQWDAHPGLLYWVGCIHVATMELVPFHHVVTQRLFFAIAHSDEISIAVGMRPLQRLKWFEELCCERANLRSTDQSGTS